MQYFNTSINLVKIFIKMKDRKILFFMSMYVFVCIL